MSTNPNKKLKTMDCCSKNDDNKLLHKIPEIKHVCLKGEKRVPEALVMKEVKLPFAKQTHELCWEPSTQSLFVSQLSNSTLVRLKVDEKGILRDEMEAWQIGPENGEMHNISLSYYHVGHLWISLQALNTLLLIDVRDGPDFMKVKQIYQVPTCVDFDGEKTRLGTPHCIRESRETGHIWACLKGAVPADHPCAKVSACCDPKILKAAMECHMKDPDLDIELPDGYGIWQLDPAKYDPNAPDGAKGGRVFKVDKSPPMSTLDRDNNMWVAQDGSPTVLFCNSKTGESEKYPVPWPLGTANEHKHTGPGIMTTPDGSIWMAQLEANGSMVRIDPATKKFVLYELQTPSWVRTIRMIHMDYNKARIGAHHNRIYAICSSLLDDDSIDALFVMNMCRDWKKIEGLRVIPLPSQLSACHRVTYCEIEDGDDECDDGSVFITEMTKAKVLQVKVNSDIHMHALKHEEYTNNGYECHRYTLTDSIIGVTGRE